MRAAINRSWQLGKLVKDFVQLQYSSPRRHRVAVHRRLVRRLERLHGLPQKIGQVLSVLEMTREDSLPLSLVDSPSSFWAGVPLSSLVGTIPPAWTDAFHHIEEEGMATSLAASASRPAPRRKKCGGKDSGSGNFPYPSPGPVGPGPADAADGGRRQGMERVEFEFQGGGVPERDSAASLRGVGLYA